MWPSPNQKFPLNPTKKQRRGRISQEKNGRDPLGGTDFFLDLSWNVVTKFVVFKERD